MPAHMLERGLRGVRTATHTVAEGVRILRAPTEKDIFLDTPPTEQMELSAKRFWTNLQKKTELLQAGDESHANIKTALDVGGGAMAGIASARMLEELRDADVLNSFDIIVGHSAGLANCAYALGAKNGDGSNIYEEMLAASGEFIEAKGIKHLPKKMQFAFVEEFFKGMPGSLHLEFLEKVLRSERGIDPEKIRKARPDLYAAVTNRYGQTELINVKTLSDDDMYAAIIASCSAPWAYNKGVRVGDRTYADGYLNGFAVDKLIEMGYDNLLVLSNAPQDSINETKSPKLERAAVLYAMLGYPIPVIGATIDRRRRQQVSLYPLRNPDINSAIVSPSKKIDWLTTDPDVLAEAKEAAGLVMKRELERHAISQQFY